MNGLLNGYGREIYPTTMYNGEFKNGKMHGSGKLICIIYYSNNNPFCPDGKEYGVNEGII